MKQDEQNFLYEFLGNKIREIRISSDMSQKELASKLSLSRASIVNIEKGRQHPSLHLIIDISRIFNVPLNFFLDRRFWSDSKNDLKKVKSRIKESSSNKVDREKILEFYKKVSSK
ncbi:MAG: helix-turn-helix transcriptional regulator [Salinimicrobium sediminis]|nr:helix-turn-helix transcriptional regulator [Salinimicrobium sediminis]